MATLASHARDARPSSHTSYVGSPLRFVMLQSEVLPYERFPSATPSMHTRRARRGTANVSFQDAMHAAIGSSSPVELLSRGSEQASPRARTPKKTLPSSENRMPPVPDTAPSARSHKDDTQLPLNKHLSKAWELKEERPSSGYCNSGKLKEPLTLYLKSVNFNQDITRGVTIMTKFRSKWKQVEGARSRLGATTCSQQKTAVVEDVSGRPVFGLALPPEMQEDYDGHMRF